MNIGKQVRVIIVETERLKTPSHDRPGRLADVSAEVEMPFYSPAPYLKRTSRPGGAPEPLSGVDLQTESHG